ncbi:MAG: IS1595 family transposase [Actinobacteria bacterium]|nr:IS1595 family transposase [Actinomycetota bacterium]
MRFPDEEACQDYLFRRRWPDGYACPRCGGTSCSHISTRNLYQCLSCSYQVSLTALTVMDKTRTPLRIWFGMIFLTAHHKAAVSILEASRILGIPYKRASLLAQRIREAIENTNSDHKLSGVVELGYAYIGGKHRPVKILEEAYGKIPVLAAVSVERDRPRYASIRVLPSLTTQEIQGAFADMVESDASVVTYGLLAYTLACMKYKGNVKTIGDPRTASEKLPFVHSLVTNVSATISGTHRGVSRQRTQYYLAETCWKFCEVWKEGDPFDRLLCMCTCSKSVAQINLR